MARIWMCGLEQDSVDVFDLIGGAFAISSAAPRSDTFHVRTTGSGSVRGRVDFSTPGAQLYLRVYARTITNTPAATAVWFVLADENGVSLLSITETGQVWLGDEGVGVDKGNAGALTTPYQRWEFRFLVDNAAGLLDVRVDGVSMVSDSGIDTRVGAVDTIGHFWLGNVDASAQDVKDFDDIAVNNVLGPDNNSWCGQGAILHGVAIANGNVNDFGRFPDGGEANWEDVDEIPPDDNTTYVIAGAIGDTELYEITDFESTYGLNRATQVKAVAWWIRARLRYNGDGELSIMHRQGGMSSEVDQYPVNEIEYAYIDHVEDLDPATALAWDIGDVDDSEFGFQSKAP